MSYLDERRRDRAADRAEDREDRRAQRAEDRADRAAAEERARRAKKDKQREADRRRAEGRARRAELLSKLSSEGDTVAALVVMVCSIVPAVYFQLRALMSVPGLPGAIAVALAVMLEAGAWVATVAGERAKREGRPVGRFRAAMWGCASVAAAVNYSHAPSSAHNWLAYVLAVASLGGVFFWELRGLGRHGGKAGRTRAERREAAARRHRIARRIRFRDVHKRYRQIMTAHPYGTVKREQAWAEAWFDIKGAPLSVTAQVIGGRVAAVQAVEKVITDAEMTPEAATVELLLADLFPTAPGDDGPTGTVPGDSPEDGPHGGGDGGTRRLSQTRSQSPTTLGGKGKRASDRTARTAAQKPLAEADLAKVRALADALGDTAHLSVNNVKAAVGGGRTEYLVRLRDAVREERRSQG
ncbi:DUF2637 domain-containing protein [Streptomyces malaysiensis]|uniref:DUF2637 domain-containing protein n=1 Tax=Streptomyces malaysiensis TaxID=92644 RepID=A0A2J7Z9U9_STRMQ|nr:DUF2637 domain-containing protein [Streptomyces malaysiensis]PNG97034.1 hypothetical protein SMF913_13059 [Streptomyces malaysiensis]